ncbi:MAG: hypothetical protein PHW62_00580 [Candidatus Ratteibacteria bacterium]|nr:hypothetical protein [Candidatus Ratteibacteria bacterium]
MKRKTRQKQEKQIDQTRVVALLAIIILVIAIFVIINNPKSLNLGTITGGVVTEYKTPVSGTVTISYVVNTWNGRQWYWPDLDYYQYNYDLINTETGKVIARGNSWRLIHSVSDSITLKMNIQGTYKYRLQETVIFLKEGGKTMNGTAKDFTVIVGTGINPTPTPPPSAGTGGTATVISEPIEEVTVITTPEPTITFQPYDAGAPIPTPAEIKITPTVTATPVHTGTPVITTVPPVQQTSTDDSDLTFVPAPTATETPVKGIPGFEGILVIMSLIIMVRSWKW